MLYMLLVIVNDKIEELVQFTLYLLYISDSRSNKAIYTSIREIDHWVLTVVLYFIGFIVNPHAAGAVDIR